MDLHTLSIFLAVATEKSFSLAAEKVYRTQPAISLAVQRLERDLGEKLFDRSGREVVLTDAGRIVMEFGQRFRNLEQELLNALAELRDVAAGRLVIGANESTSIYLLQHIQRFRHQYPKVRIIVRRCLSSQIPTQITDGDLELGVISWEPADDRIESRVIYSDRLVFVVAPRHRLARRESVSITELGGEHFVAHNVRSPYREIVLRDFQRYKVPLNMDVEMPTVETIRKLVQRNEGVAFLPRMCVEQELQQGTLREVKVEEMHVERKIRLVHPAGRQLSHAALAFLEVVRERSGLHKRRK